MEIQEGKAGVKVCVTGGGGYIGSWLVKSLLQRGYTVNATLRDPKNEEKIGPLLSLTGAAERLRLFEADLSEEGSFDSAVEGCHGVFHVASPMDFSKNSEDDFVEPAVKGVLNVLHACSRAKSVKRVVYTSSTAAICPLNEEGEVINNCSIDESIWTPVEVLRGRHQYNLGFYFMAKTLAEQAAIEYGSNSEMEVVTIGPSMVWGPCITSTFPLSCGALIGVQPESSEQGDYRQFKFESLSVVHIDDVCEAHIFLMEQPTVQGRHICSAFTLTSSELTNMIHKLHSHCTPPFKFDGEDGEIDSKNCIILLINFWTWVFLSNTV